MLYEMTKTLSKICKCIHFRTKSITSLFNANNYKPLMHICNPQASKIKKFQDLLVLKSFLKGIPTACSTFVVEKFTLAMLVQYF